MFSFLIAVAMLFLGVDNAKKRKIFFASVLLSSTAQWLLEQVALILIQYKILPKFVLDNLWINAITFIVTIVIAYFIAKFISKQFGNS